MPFTPDTALDLLFPEELIPQHVKDELPPDLHVRLLISPLLFSFDPAVPLLVQIRPLASTDYERGHLSVLSVLTQTPDVGAAAWTSQFHALNSASTTYYILVIVSRETDRIVGTGGVFIERKFLRGLGRVGHIEDIAVAREMQGKKLGLRIIEALTYISENAGCYKTILNCSDANIRASVFVISNYVLLTVSVFLPTLAFYEKCGYEKRESEMVIAIRIAPLYAADLLAGEICHRA
jgi:glucosamine-phosphate N-acetyltransferase